MAEKINFTKKTLEQIEPPTEKGARLVFHDNRIKGLQLRVTASGNKTFSVYKKFQGKPVRVTLGKFPEITPDQARKLAHQKLAEIAEGKNPNETEKHRQIEQISLQGVFNNLIETRTYKTGTIRDYQQAIKTAFADWKDKPLNHITEEKC
jgi:hypothetical protein